MPEIGFFLVVVGIPVTLGIGFGAFERWLKHKEKMAAVVNTEAMEMLALQAAQSERMEQRLRVLERIVTDTGADVAGQIEQLRTLPGANVRALRSTAEGVAE